MDKCTKTSTFSLLIAGAIALISSPTASTQEQNQGPFILPLEALPEYEAKIDHARLIRHKGAPVIHQGAKIYQQVCHNCHGSPTEEGSIPNALKFWEGEFQNGADPHAMYNTITRGWRGMVPQMQLTPIEKYAVIHYIRTAFLREKNPSQFTRVDDAYIKSLPEGRDMGPMPIASSPWSEMDYGVFLNGSFELSTAEERAQFKPGTKDPKTSNIAYKGIAIRLNAGDGGVSKGNHWVAFEHDTMRLAGSWTGNGFIDWQGINFNGRHAASPRTIGTPQFQTKDGPGWANPETGTFDDLRTVGADGRHFGPLPKSWASFHGTYKQGRKVTLSYSIGDAKVLESHEVDSNGHLVRQLNIAKSSKALKLRIADTGTQVATSSDKQATLSDEAGYKVVSIPAAATPLKLAITIGSAQAASNTTARDLKPFTAPGPAQWPSPITTKVEKGTQDGAFQWDALTIPKDNPWNSRLRTTGVDFSADGASAFVCCWDGDVWRVDGLNKADANTIQWTRIASGLFQPLGIKIRDGEILVNCRDQIVRLVDMNQDGETDFYQNFNSDHQVTEHYHEFAMGLQVDDDGNLYYAKSARHAAQALVPQHGTLLKVSADGTTTEILAHGFRAANGVCRNPDGSFFVTDQEGNWNPMNRINWVQAGDRFYGNMWGYGAPEDTSDSMMEQPLCWVDKNFDRSPAELLWIDSESWGALNGKLMHLSYGHGRLEIIPHESIDGQMQGGAQRFPIPDLPTGIMRGRFNPTDGHLYTCGMAAWGTARMQEPGGLYRIRATGKPAYLATEINAFKGGVRIQFCSAFHPKSINDVARQFQVRTWELKRTAKYGSDRYNEKTLAVTDASLSADGTTLTLEIPEIEPCWQMSIKALLKSPDGNHVHCEIQNTIHTLADQ
ncbi:DUF6797 domain-containing protein [Rubritalea marina]|uniref:DUF6797 domain-containing protein n=1 Tax=Rubritalea marina TaxID=361055 RepID=UPI00039D43EF|nr:DUF6797 domain-containing protein [Rubritalea marina]